MDDAGDEPNLAQLRGGRTVRVYSIHLAQHRGGGTVIVYNIHLAQLRGGRTLRVYNIHLAQLKGERTVSYTSAAQWRENHTGLPNSSCAL